MKYDIEEDDGLFDSKYTPLNRSQAIEIFGESALSPKVVSPWQIVKFQSVLTIAFTIPSIVFGFAIYGSQNIAISILLGGLLGILPTVAFILRMELWKKAGLKDAKRYVGGLVKAEVIKITLSLTILIFVVRFFQGLHWMMFLGMYLITLQAYWLVGLIKNK
jgi:F0F1-type ATP synthase assembly protein I